MKILKMIIKKIIKKVIPRKLINTLITLKTDVIDVDVLWEEGGLRNNLLELQQLKQRNAYIIRREKGMNRAKNYLLGLNRNEQDAETLKIIEFLEKSNPFLMYAYDFIKEYNPLCVNVLKDETCDMNYVLHGNKRMYFPQTFDTVRCRDYYNTLLIEQDTRSPHRYDTLEFAVKTGDVIADVGAAEGIWALTHVEQAEKIYLFECNPEWTAVLQKTFEPWKDKTVIINKYLTNVNNDEGCVTFDCFISGGKINVIKADIEGHELNLLAGAQKTLASAVDLKLLLCAYHRYDDAENIKSVLENSGFDTEFSDGYMFSPIWSMDVCKGGLVKGVIRGRKNQKYAPSPEIPASLENDFTMNGKINVSYNYYDSRVSSPIRNTRQTYECVFLQLNSKQFSYYGDDVLSFYDAFTDYPLEDKIVLIFGLAGCNCEAMALWKNAKKVYVVDYNKPICEHERIEVLTHDELSRSGLKFDIGISFSSFEHDGLGRYGDPITPDGDFNAMQYAKSLIVDDGLFFLGVPMGKDCLVWNAHRIYGQIRLPILIKDWLCQDVYHKSSVELFNAPLSSYIQPLVVLKNVSKIKESDFTERQNYAKNLQNEGKQGTRDGALLKFLLQMQIVEYQTRN